MFAAGRLLVLVVLTTVVLLVGVFFSAPFRIVLTSLQELETATFKRQDLERLARATYWRLLAKNQVMEEVLQGRLTLLEAAAWFQWLNSQPPQLPFEEKRRFQGTVEERCCRDVILFAHVEELRSIDSRHARLVDRLEEELQESLESPGGLVLPPPPFVPGIPSIPEMG